MFSCPNCGGNVTFDIPTQQLACEFCHELYNPYSFENKTSDAEETTAFENDYEVTVFTCPQCGGEILSTDNAAAGFCSFCGASTILYSRISHERRPNFIIPFQKTKDDCKQAYASMMKRAIFAPKELKDSKFIDGFRGIYMPYWAFYITQNGPFALKATKEYRRGSYIYTDHYELSGELDSYYKGLSYDASSSFADNISESLAPYDLKGMKQFTPSYLSGFYADTADVAPSVYQTDAEYTAYKQTAEEFQKVPTFGSYNIDFSKTTPTSFQTKTKNVDSTMFPVWFMSYRKNDRVAYVTVNGQTGKVVADIPIDPKKYVLGSLCLAIPLFIIFASFLTLLPSGLLMLSLILVLVTTIIYTVELCNIAKKESFAEDRGKLYSTNRQGLHKINEKIKKTRTPSGPNTISNGLATATIVFIALVCFSPLIEIILFASPIVLGLVVLAGMITVLVIGCKKMNTLPGKNNIFGYLFSTLATVISVLIILIHPVSDWFYYGGTILGLAAVIVSICDIIRYYNILSTRRLPQFNHQGGDDRA